MTSSDHPHLTRRTFVGAVASLGAAIGAAAVTGTTASAQAKLARAVGVARIGSTVHTLGRTPDGWSLIAANGTTRPTTGLDNADLLDLATAIGGVVAVGSTKEGGRDVPAVFESLDGLSWTTAARLTGLDGHLSAVATNGSTAIAVGAHLTLERSPLRRLTVHRTSSGWSVVPTTGLEYTDEWAATAAAGGAGGWALSTVDSTGASVATSSDGLTWTQSGQLVDAAVRSLAFTGSGIRWVGNAMSGSGGITGVLGASRRPVPVPEGAEALGVIGDRSYWLVDGRIVSATV